MSIISASFRRFRRKVTKCATQGSQRLKLDTFCSFGRVWAAESSHFAAT